jgi:hypothetical protein
MVLAVLAYNLTRVMNIVSIRPLMPAIRAHFDGIPLAALFAIRWLWDSPPEIGRMSLFFPHPAIGKALNLRFDTTKTPSRRKQAKRRRLASAVACCGGVTRMQP